MTNGEHKIQIKFHLKVNGLFKFKSVALTSAFYAIAIRKQLEIIYQHTHQHQRNKEQ